jgi:hypothetical protein
MKSVVSPRIESLEFYGILPGFVLYWTALAATSWIWLIIWKIIKDTHIPWGATSILRLISSL